MFVNIIDFICILFIGLSMRFIIRIILDESEDC